MSKVTCKACKLPEIVLSSFMYNTGMETYQQIDGTALYLPAMYPQKNLILHPLSLVMGT